MKRFRTPLIVLGIAGAVVVALAVVIVISVGRGPVVELPVAVDDVEAGTLLDAGEFRLVDVRGLDTSAYVTLDEFGDYVGYPLIEPVHAGFPVGKAQVALTGTQRYQTRLTLLLDDPTHLVFPLDVEPGQTGNYIYSDDYVDVIFTLGRVAVHEMTYSYLVTTTVPGLPSEPVTNTNPATGAVTGSRSWGVEKVGEVVTTTVELPLSKVILPDVHVLRVEREEVRSASASYGGGEGQTLERSSATAQGDVERLYLELDREQAEILAFAVHNGVLNLPARAEPARGESGGFVWDDFVERFFEDRIGSRITTTAESTSESVVGESGEE